MPTSSTPGGGSCSFNPAAACLDGTAVFQWQCIATSCGYEAPGSMLEFCPQWEGTRFICLAKAADNGDTKRYVNLGLPCRTSADCYAGGCNPTRHTCGAPGGSPCMTSEQCFSLVCNASKQCQGDAKTGETCGANVDCASNNCSLVRFACQ